MDAGAWEIVTCAAPQAVQIGDEIEIAVVSVENGRVRLGITAPGRRLWALDPVTLPAGVSEIRPRGLGRGLNWPSGRTE